MKFCIMCAGKGTRNSYFEGLHKALLPLGNQATISKVIEKVDKDVEIVLAVGYKAEQIRSYMDQVHPDRRITYVYVDNFEGPGSGPGYSLQCCKNHLQEPFILTSVDTVILDDIIFNDVKENWIGVADVSEYDSHKYCLVKSSGCYLDELYFGVGTLAYIGMAGIHDFETFWSTLESGKIIKGEFQVVHGFDNLKNVRVLGFDWHDTGNNEAYEKTRSLFKDVVANKNNEAIFIDNGHVIKFFSDTSKVDQRIERTKYLKNICPDTNRINEHMYHYDYVKGQMLSNVFDDEVFTSFLYFCINNLFLSKEYVNVDKFQSNCFDMYEKKTRSRLSKMSMSDLDKIEKINGVSVSPIEVLIERINWKEICSDAIPSGFHGDLQPENILVESDGSFKLIDWRESFGNDVEIGDLYYDLSKIYHALLINGQTVLKKYYDFRVVDNEAYVSFYIKSNLVSFMQIFEDFCELQNYDWHRVKMLGALHFLNISTLYDNFHEGLFGKFLFLLGKYLLTRSLNGN